MKYRFLGKTGLLVSRMCLGTLTFGAKEWGCEKESAIRLIHKYLDLGGNFIDVADIYAGGLSETIVGDALKDRSRDDVIVATKCFFRTRPFPNAKGLSRKHIIEAVENSLRKLKTEYIDLFYIHAPDPHTPYEETMTTLDGLVRQGKIRYIGCSNIPSWHILKANGVSERMNLEKFSCGQYMHNLIDRDCERDILPACEDQGMGFVCWSPLGGGVLTGKYNSMEKPYEGTRLWHRSNVDGPRFWHERGISISKSLESVAKQSGYPASKLALAWPLSDKRISSVIAGVKNETQLKQNMKAAECNLPHELYKLLNDMSSYNLGYLTSFIDNAGKGVLEDTDF